MYTSLNIAISLKRTSFSTPASLWVNLWRHWSDANFICEVTSLSLAGVPITSFLRWAKPRFIDRIGFLFTKIIFGSSDMSWWRLACLSLGSVCISSFYKNFRNEHFVREAKKNTKSHTWCVSFLRFGFLEKKISNTSSLRTQTKWNHMRPASSPQKSQTKTGLVAAFLWSSSREKRNLYIQVFTTSPGSGSSWNVFCFPNWRAFSWTTKNEAKTNDHYLKNHIYISANFRPTKIGTCLARIWKSNTDQQKKSNVAPVATFMGVFGEPWKSNKLRWQFRCWWFLGLKAVKRNRRGDQKPMQKHHVQIWNQKKGWKIQWKFSPPWAVKTFHESMTLYLEDHPI